MAMHQLLVRGLIAGLLAGVLAFAFARVFAEPSIDAAIAFEERLAAVQHQPVEPELVSRAIQSTIGLGTGVVVLAIAFGGSFAIAFAFAFGRLGALHARGTALMVALLGFLAVYGVPFLKYPPNPPAVGDPSTIQARTALYFATIAIGVLATAGAARLQRQFAEHRSNLDAALIAAAAFIVVVGAAIYALPAVKGVPEGFPPSVLWEFRLASLGTQLVLWLGMGLIFGWLTERAQRTATRAAAAPAVTR
jgi:predicted cobalt transporter CbtA